MALFFLLNYFAHAATVRPRPGERLGSTVLNAALALIYPYSGLERGIQGILRRTIFIKDELEQAAAEEALCIVIRSQEWRPWGGEALQVTRGIPTRENNAPEHQGLSFPMGESRTEIAEWVSLYTHLLETPANLFTVVLPVQPRSQSVSVNQIGSYPKYMIPF